MDYKVLEKQSFARNEYEIVPVRFEDRHNIMQWRNEQMKVLRQTRLLSREEQDTYFNQVISQLFDADQPGQILFSYLKNGHLIGYGGLVHINWLDKRAEVSFLLDTRRIQEVEKYRLEMSIYLTLMKEVAFEALAFNRLFTETYDFRTEHLQILQDNGFVLEGRLRQHIFIDNRFIDSLLHGCLKSEYHNAK